MRLRKLVMHNIRSYIDESVEFPEGSTMLSGDIGAGKSTILLSIEFALFGVKRGQITGDMLLRRGCSEGFIELSFIIQKKEVVIRRTIKDSRGSVTQGSGFIMIDGVKTEGTPVELKSSILELLGYPQDLLTKSKDLVYRYTVFTPQEDMKAILFDEKEGRLETLRKVFQMDKYSKVKENAGVLISMLKEKIDLYRGKISDLESKKEQKEKNISEINEMQEQLKEYYHNHFALQLA